MIVALALFLLTSRVLAFSNYHHQAPTRTHVALFVQSNTNIDTSSSRRDWFSKTTSLVSAVSGLVIGTNPAFAEGKAPTAAELNRIRVGYEGIEYLLDNFEKETTVCLTDGGRECKRNAEPIRRYMGLRSTTDTLFQIEKVFVKAKYMNIDDDKIEDFFEATEDWNTAVSMSNSMAFISQFGEYNPGGGKEEVLKYLTESQKQVVLARDALKKIINCLDIK